MSNFFHFCRVDFRLSKEMSHFKHFFIYLFNSSSRLVKLQAGNCFNKN